DASSFGCAEEGTEVVRIFHAVEGQEEGVATGDGGASLFRSGDEVFDGEVLALADDGERALMGVGAGEPGELVARLERDTDPGGAAKIRKALELVVAAFAGELDR